MASALASCGIFFALYFAPAANAQAPVSGRPVFNILDYGAHKDGSAPSTEAFRKAIEAAKMAGGGTIYAPAGRYVSGPIELYSNMTLDVGAGARIVFPVAPLPFVKGRYLGVDALVPMPLIGGHDVTNVTVTGRGILQTGDFQAWADAYGPPVRNQSGNANGPAWEHLLKALNANQPVTQAEYLAAAKELRPDVLCFMNAKNILIQNIRIIGGPAFVVHLLYSQNATVNNVIEQSYPGAHANGIVVDSSRFVRISNDYIDTGDDGIVIKSGKGADGLRVNRPSEDVAITNCTVHHAHGAVVIGSETAGGIRNVVASNITAVGTERGIRVKSRRGRGGVIEDLRFDNWTMEHVGTGIVVTCYYIMGGEAPTKEEPVSIRTPVFRNIAISNVTISHATRAVVNIEGLPEMPITGLHLMDILGSGKRGLIAAHTNAMELRHLQINPETGPAFAIATASNLLLDGISSRDPAAGSPVLRLTASPGAILEDSHAFPGTDVFLSTTPNEKRTLQLSGDILKNAKVPMQSN